MQYSLPLTINYRRKLSAELSAFYLPTTDTFIVEVASTNAIDICSISLQEKIQCFVVQQQDVHLQKCNIFATYQDQKVIITIDANKAEPKSEPQIVPAPQQPNTNFFDDIENFSSEKKQSQATPITPVTVTTTIQQIGNLGNDLQLQWQQQANHVRLQVTASKPITATVFNQNWLTVEFVLLINDTRYTTTQKYFIAHPSQFLGIALDYGSESSQLASKRYEVGSYAVEEKPTVENLFRIIKTLHLNKQWITQASGQQFYQEEVGSNFYKSIFFIKESVSGNYSHIDEEKFVLNQNENLKLLIDTNSMAELMNNTFYQLPNMKIIQKHDDILSNIHFEVQSDGKFVNLSLKEMKDKVNNSILKTMLEAYVQQEYNRYKNVQRCIRLLLLVPNVYSHKQLQDTKLELQSILASIAAEPDYANKILAWEVNTISESDAAFSGYLNKSYAQVQPNKDYLIIDVGKGTTDFSIVKTGAANMQELQAIYRNGFAGAGNLITNAVFETVLRFIREANAGASGVNQYIHKTILETLKGNSLVVIRDFFAQIERLKFNYSEGAKEATMQKWQQAKYQDFTFYNLVEKQADFATITALLQSLDHCADFYNYLQDVCTAITQKVTTYTSLVQQYKKDTNFGGVILTGRGYLFAPMANTMKKALQETLQIPATTIQLLAGQDLKDVCIKGVFQSNITLQSNEVGMPIQMYKQETPLPKPSITVAAAKSSFKNWLYTIGVGSVEETLANTQKVVVPAAELQMQNMANSQFIIGASVYKPYTNQLQHAYGSAAAKASIVLSNEGYKIRVVENNTVLHIEPLQRLHDYEEVEKQYIIPSLFPTYIEANYLRSLQDELRGMPAASNNNVPPQAAPPPLNNDLFFGQQTPPPISNTNDLLF